MMRILFLTESIFVAFGLLSDEFGNIRALLHSFGTWEVILNVKETAKDCFIPESAKILH